MTEHDHEWSVVILDEEIGFTVCECGEEFVEIKYKGMAAVGDEEDDK